MSSNIEFSHKLARQLKIKYRDAEKLLSDVSAVVMDLLAQGEEVRLFKWLTLSTFRKESYQIKSINSKQPITIPDQIIPKARFGVEIKNKLNGGVEELHEDNTLEVME